jgi:hypothetical protein
VSQLEQARVVEVVLPPNQAAASRPAPVSTSGAAWWIAVPVLIVLAANIMLVWWRVKGRDPLREAFDAGARRAGLDRREKKLVERLAGQSAPIALLISDSALTTAAAGIGAAEEPLIGNIRRKLSQVQS